MHCVRKVKDDLYYVGGSDRRLELFENMFPIPRGVSYNSYLLSDEKTVLFDTVDYSVGRQFFENLEYALGGRPLDYAIVNHMEPDHSATLGELIARYPDCRVVCNKKTLAMIKQFFKFESDSRIDLVEEGDTLKTGRHTLTFVMAPMVHWPEVMVTYDTTDKILFSADAFGTFGALNGNIFADEVDFKGEWLADARRYYTNIVGRFGAQVQALLKKAAGLEIDMICPLHGPIWRENIEFFVDKYNKWSTYTPEDNAVMIAYGSVYGNTENAAEILASCLADRGVKNIAMYDVSKTHSSILVAEAYRCSHLVFAAVTYCGGMFFNMQTALEDLSHCGVQNRTAALMQNGTWAATAAKKMREIIDGMKNMTVIEKSVDIKSTLADGQQSDIEELADEIVKSMKK